MTAIVLKHRSPGGAAGAPSALKTGELAWNMVDGYFYGGYGDDGSGNATSIKIVTKDDFNVSQRVPEGGTTGQLLSRNSSGDAEWIDPPEGGTTVTGGTGINVVNGVVSIDTSVVATDSDLSDALALKAPLASPALTGTPTAPTATASTANTQIATTAYVTSAVNGIVNGAGAAYDTLAELADLIQNDESGIAALTTTVGEKLAKASNLSDLTDAAAARTNLALGSMATQAASSVAITGGTISGVVIDGGTF